MFIDLMNLFLKGVIESPNCETEVVNSFLNL